MENPDEKIERESELESLARGARSRRAPASPRKAPRRSRYRAAGVCAALAVLATAGSLCLIKSMSGPRGASAFSPPATRPSPSPSAPTSPVYPEFHYPHPHYANTSPQTNGHPNSTGELFPDAKSGK
jgi:hypothetical protein